MTMCTCPHCGLKCTREEDGSFPVVCPNCAADLYTEEVEYIDLLTAEPVETV